MEGYGDTPFMSPRAVRAAEHQKRAAAFDKFVDLALADVISFDEAIGWFMRAYGDSYEVDHIDAVSQ
jgi:hypothetical protein